MQYVGVNAAHKPIVCGINIHLSKKLEYSFSHLTITSQKTFDIYSDDFSFNRYFNKSKTVINDFT